MITSRPAAVAFPRNHNRRHQVWQSIIAEARQASREQPEMASFFHSNVLNHNSFQDSLSFYIASHLGNATVSAMTLQTVFLQALNDRPQIVEQMLDDLLAHYSRDPACDQTIIPLLYFKGFHAIQTHRIAHWLWRHNRKLLATYLQHRGSELFHVDIHPAARLGCGIMLDHAIGLVIGETAVVGDSVSILHEVTLGGCGSHSGDRHPKVGSGVLLSAGATLLGNIMIGENTRIGAGSVVLQDVPAGTTVAGVPARQVGRVSTKMPSLDMDQSID